jgi:hypothetical protein
LSHATLLLLLQGAVSPWVLGWQFAAGEHIPQDKDVFGDLGKQEVQLVQGQQQGVAVFSEWQLGFSSKKPQLLLCICCILVAGTVRSMHMHAAVLSARCVVSHYCLQQHRGQQLQGLRLALDTLPGAVCTPCAPRRAIILSHDAYLCPLAGDSSIRPGPEGQAAFSFVGRKGQNTTSSAPFRLAPPAHMFLNNLFCWPLFRPSPAAAAAAGAGSTSSNGSTVLGRAAAAASTAADQLFGVARGAPPAAEQQQQQPHQQQQIAVAVPQLPAAQMPQRLLVEYSPVDIMPNRLRGPGWFYFRYGGSTAAALLQHSMKC